MDTETPYSDGLITITPDTVVFHNYYFFGINRVVPVSNIERIERCEPTVWNGQWRLWGTGRPGVWFPMDWKRPGRDCIFIASLRDTSFKIGFTVQDSFKVEEILRQMHLM